MKKIWVCCMIVILTLFVFTLTKTYSYYVDAYNNPVNYKIANWSVVVNDSDITTEENKKFTINNCTYKKSDKSNLLASNNKFAPGMVAECTISIDSKKVDVAFDYYLDIDLSNLENDNIVISYVNNSLSNIETIDNTYHGFFDKESIESNKKDLITIGIEWLDTESSNDYEFREKYDGVLNVPVELRMKQKME